MRATLDTAKTDLDHARDVALGLKEQLDAARMDMQRIVWAMVIANGGTFTVPYQLLACNGGRLTRHEDFENNAILLKADMGIGKDLTK